MGVLLLNAAATWFMAGLHWFVQVVHYPLFAQVGDERFPGYHRRHSARTTMVVLPAMTVELVTSAWLVAAPPAGADRGLAVVGLLLALVTWASTGLLQVPRHGELAGGFDAGAHRRLVSSSWVRTCAWTAHGAIVAVLLAQAS